MDIPTANQVEEGCKAFARHERRDAIYKTATFLVDRQWGRPTEMADGLGLMLLTWNYKFYRGEPFDFDRLEACIADNMDALAAYRQRTILDQAEEDDASIGRLFGDFLDALAIADGAHAGDKSPVAAAKALHFLAPAFFPLWDLRIAQAYGCDFAEQPAARYLAFLKIIRDMARHLGAVTLPPGKTLLKVIDEYNYARYSRQWL